MMAKWSICCSCSLGIKSKPAECILCWSGICSLTARCWATYRKNPNLWKSCKIFFENLENSLKIFTIDSDKIAHTSICRYYLGVVGINPNAECCTREIRLRWIGDSWKFDTAPNIGVTTTRLIWTKLKELKNNHDTGVIP